MQNTYFEPIRGMRPIITFGQALLSIAAMVCISGGLQAQAGEPQHADELAARVNQHEISQPQFQAYFAQTQRQEFYHRTPPEDELQAFRVKTINELVNRLLLQDEAARRGIQPDTDEVNQSIEQLTKRYEGNAEFEANRDETIASLRSQLESASRIEQLEADTRDVGEPSEQQLEAYYEANPDTFTEPRQRKVSLILVQVDPSSTQEVREAALAEAEGIVERLNNGEDFAMLAEALSDDGSAENGGSMGWLHEGLLNDQAETALSEMAAGDISEPVRVLEGYAVLRLDEIKESALHSLDHVRARATTLWQREEGERAWEGLIEALRAVADIEILDPSLIAEASAQSA